MSDLKDIKRRIYEEQSIQDVLYSLGCEMIRQEAGGNRIVAALPPEFNRKNKRAVQIYNDENLNGAIRNVGVKGDIFAIVGYILYGCGTFEEIRSRLFDIKKWICETLGYQDFLEFNGEQQERIKKQDWNRWLHNIKRKRKRNTVYKDNPILPESALNAYFMYPVQWWIDEGISWQTQKEFNIGFDLYSKRIVIPIHNKNGELIGVKSRYVGKNKAILENVKYLYLHPCNKGVELYSLHRALSYILEKKEVIVFESEKSCLLAWEYGYRNCVGVGGDAITEAQVKLLKDLGLDVKIVFAYDKDKENEWIKQQLKGIFGRSVYCIYDTKRLLEDKDSPLDRGREIFDRLYKECCFRVNKEDE